MNGKNNLLSIGDMAKLTETSVKSLRYYERINILKPAYIDPGSKYRYYTFAQASLVGIIKACIEFDIPLKELAGYVDMDGIVNFRKLLLHGKEKAQMKIINLERGLKLIEKVEDQIDQSELYEFGQIYTQELPEKYFKTKPCGAGFNETALLELVMESTNLFTVEDDYDETLEYGFLCAYSTKDATCHAFVELPARLAAKGSMTVPAGAYLCRQDEGSRIKQAPEIFKKHDTFLAIETEIYTNMYNISKPIYELRVSSSA